MGSRKNLTRIPARKCIVKKISSSKKNVFLNMYHIQGADTSNINLGLYYITPENKLKLVAVMTFCKPRISLGQKKNTYDYELSRYATNSHYIVQGGYSKLFAYFENNYTWSKLITYADRRWSTGRVYELNGWKFDHYSEPNYWYITPNGKRVHRYGYRKSILQKKLPQYYDSTLSEKHIMCNAHYDYIYDCGNIVYTYTRGD
jgi:hypothetical protein